MKNLIRLTKINALTIYDFYKLRNASTKEEKKKAIGKLFLVFILFIYFGGFIFYYAYNSLKGLKALNLSDLLLPVGMCLSSSYILFVTLFKINKTVFDAKDYSILLSLPIKKSVIISSKLITLYLINILYTIILMIPIYLAYILNVSTSLLFNLSFGLSFLFIPLVPTVIGALIGTLITGISSKFKHKNFFNIIFNIILMILIMYVSYSTNTLNSKALAQISQSILNFFNHVYPLTNIYHKALNGQILYLIIYIIISLGIYELYKYLTVIFFDKINSNLKSITIINKYDNKKNKINVPLISLFKKEFSHYLSSTIYFLNTGVGMILLTIATISLIISGPKNLGSLLNIPNLSNIINKSLPLIIALFSALSCTTYPSISLEGKNFWILKTLPIKTNTILKSKLLLNYIITIPLIIINTSILAIYLHLSLINYLFSLIIPILYALFIAGYGLFINILMPDFEWSNEVKVIKQSTSSLVSIFTGLILVMVPLTINYSISNNKFMILLISIILLLNILIYYLLFTIGKKKYELL